MASRWNGEATCSVVNSAVSIVRNSFAIAHRICQPKLPAKITVKTSNRKTIRSKEREIHTHGNHWLVKVIDADFYRQ